VPEAARHGYHSRRHLRLKESHAGTVHWHGARLERTITSSGATALPSEDPQGFSDVLAFENRLAIERVLKPFELGLEMLNPRPGASVLQRLSSTAVEVCPRGLTLLPFRVRQNPLAG
jgi:hypothetical protein